MNSRGIILRSGNNNDAEALAKIYWRIQAKNFNKPIDDVVIDSQDTEEASRWLDKKDSWSQVALIDNKLVGFIIGYPIEDDKEYISYLMVEPNKWRHGLGGALVDWAIDNFQQEGKTSILLWMVEDNIQAQEFYENRGFAKTGKSRIHEVTKNKEIEYCFDLKKDTSTK